MSISVCMKFTVIVQSKYTYYTTILTFMDSVRVVSVVYSVLVCSVATLYGYGTDPGYSPFIH